MKNSPIRFAVSAVVAVTSLLSVFSSAAQAHWDTAPPVYTTTNRLYDGGPDPFNGNDNRPWGGGNSDYNNASIQGTVSAKFTWVHDVANDAAPTDVYVLEHGFANWDIAGLLGPPPNAFIRPSVQNVALSSRHRGRFIQVQAQTAYGTADDGLGDDVSMTSDGLFGVSQGYKVVLCHPATVNGVITLTTADVILSASVDPPPGANGLPYWEFSAQIVDLKITRAIDPVHPIDITNPNNPEQDVMVGEKVSLNVAMPALPTDAGTPTYQWTIGGNDATNGSVIKDFLTTGQIANPHVAFTGHKDPLTAADLQLQNPHFYWYNGTLTGTSQEVSVVVTIDGKPITVKAKFKVYRPNFDGLTITYQKQTGIHEAEPMIEFDLLDSISFTPLSPGVKFVGVATVPNVSVAAGQIALQQLALSTSDVKVKNEVVIPHTYKQLVDEYGIDTLTNNQIFSMPGLTANAPRIETRKPITPDTDDGTAFVEGNDQPQVPSNDWTKIIAKFDFTMYLMYKPDSAGSIWVPLGKQDWGWGFTATDVNYTRDWAYTNPYPSVAGATGNIGTDTHDLPTWDSRPQDAYYTPIAAW